jgi:hypothetical protein
VPAHIVTAHSARSRMLTCVLDHALSQDELAPLFDGAAWAGTQLWDAAIQGASSFIGVLNILYFLN